MQDKNTDVGTFAKSSGCRRAYVQGKRNTFARHYSMLRKIYEITQLISVIKTWYSNQNYFPHHVLIT